MPHEPFVSIPDIVRQLCEASDGLVRPSSGGCHPNLPSQGSLARLVDDLRSVLFPGYFGTTAELSAEALQYHVGSTLDRVVRRLIEQVRRAFCFTCDERSDTPCRSCEERARVVSAAFVSRLPDVRIRLASDVRAAYRGDPAATGPAEIILCYPAIYALMCHRTAHELHRLQVPLLPRMLTEHAHAKTGIDIHPGAEIGEECFIDHGTGVVIGETAVIGRRVRLYQGVTLGARTFPMDADGHLIKGIARHPILEDDVVIYGGATVLGRIRIGAGSVIGGNVWLTHSVPPGSRVLQVEVRQVRFEDGGGI